MISLELSDVQQQLQQHFRERGASALRPLAMELDRSAPGPLDQRLMAFTGQERLNGLLIPEQYGGKPLDSITLAIVVEELGWALTDLAAVFQSTLHTVKTILIGGTEEQKQQFLPPLLTPEGAVAAFCPTEEQGGSDSSSFRTTARSEKGGYRISGTKTPVVNAGTAQFYVVWANLDSDPGRSGINAFIVPAETSGIVVGSYYDKSGYRGAPIASVTFDGVFVPERNLMGSPGSGYLLLMQAIDSGRPFVGACSVGLARAALEIALDFSKTRIIKNRSILSNQGVGFPLAELQMNLEAARLLVWRACERMDRGHDYTAAAAMAKLFASELAVRATDEGILILGKSSMHRSSPMEKLLRDAQLTRIVDGTSHIQKAIILSQL